MNKFSGPQKKKHNYILPYYIEAFFLSASVCFFSIAIKNRNVKNSLHENYL